MYIVGKREVEAIKKVIEKGIFFRYGGTETVKFEQEFAKFIGVKYAYATSSGTAALIVALQALGIGPGDSVLVPAYTFISTALAVTAVGAIPIITDIDESLTIDPADIEHKLEKHTKCIIPVHMQGMPCNMEKITAIASKHNVLVLEDCAQACGGSYRNRMLGSIGHMGAFSFNQYKIISSGEGGAVSTSNQLYAERAYMAQDGSCSVWPETEKTSSAFFCSANYRFNDLNAAMLRVQLKRLKYILKKLRDARKLIKYKLKLPPGVNFILSHDEEGNCGVSFLLQAETVSLAEKVEEKLKNIFKVHRPINSGRHVYKSWDVLKNKIGGHHPAWDCFKHPLNLKIKTNYNEILPQADEYLSKTVLCHTPFVEHRKLTKLISEANFVLRKI